MIIITNNKSLFLLLHIIHFNTLKSKFFNNFKTKAKIHQLQKPLFNTRNHKKPQNLKYKIKEITNLTDFFWIIFQIPHYVITEINPKSVNFFKISHLSQLLISRNKPQITQFLKNWRFTKIKLPRLLWTNPLKLLWW